MLLPIFKGRVEDGCTVSSDCCESVKRYAHWFYWLPFEIFMHSVIVKVSRMIDLPQVPLFLKRNTFPFVAFEGRIFNHYQFTDECIITSSKVI